MTDKLGCFGSVLYHDPESRRCSNCPLVTDCSAASADNDAKLQEWMGKLVADKKNNASKRTTVRKSLAAIAGPTAAPTTTASASRAASADDVELKKGHSLKKKPEEFVRKWIAKGLDFEAMRRGVNPFANTGNKFAIVAADYIMANPTCTRDQLNDHFQDKLKWGAGTAASHVNIICDTFEYLGIITVHGKNVHLRT